MSIKTIGNEQAVFINQDEGMFIALPITLDSNTHTLETYTRNGRTIVRAGSVVKESSVVRGILAEEYDITEGTAQARIVVRGYAYASRLTNAAVEAVASLPEIYLMPYKTVVVSVDEIDGKKATLHMEGAKWAESLAVDKFTFTESTAEVNVASAVKVDSVNNTVTITFTNAGTYHLTAINGAAFVGASGATLKGLPIEMTVGASE